MKTNIMKLGINALGLAVALVAATGVASLFGCAGNRYEQSTGERIDDKATPCA